MKYFVVADIHGFYDKMIKALKDAGFDRDNPEHIFVSLGDLFDRGDQAVKCLEFVMSLNPAQRILIRGNHEDLMEEAISRHRFYYHDFSNGTVDTAFQLTGAKNEFDALKGMREHYLYNQYIKSCIDFYETDNYVFVHGWIPCRSEYGTHKVNTDAENYYITRDWYSSVPDWRIGIKDDWKRARWYNGMDAWAQGVRDEKGKIICCGHWHTSWGHYHLHSIGSEDFLNPAKPEKRAVWDVFEDKGIRAVDACTAYSSHMNCLVLEDTDTKEEEKI